MLIYRHLHEIGTPSRSNSCYSAASMPRVALNTHKGKRHWLVFSRSLTQASNCCHDQVILSPCRWLYAAHVDVVSTSFHDIRSLYPNHLAEIHRPGQSKRGSCLVSRPLLDYPPPCVARQCLRPRKDIDDSTPGPLVPSPCWSLFAPTETSLPLQTRNSI